MRFFSLLLFLSFFSCPMRANGGENRAVHQLFERAVNAGDFGGIKILLTEFPEFKERIQRFTYAYREQGRISVKVEIEHALYDFCEYLRDLE